jgi:hypothetical protein
MSEYQFYEFIDRPLKRDEQAALRACSSRARINATHFVNEYHWGDLKGDPMEWMRKYFDAHVYAQQLRIPHAGLPFSHGMDRSGEKLRDQHLRLPCRGFRWMAGATTSAPIATRHGNWVSRWRSSDPARVTVAMWSFFREPVSPLVARRLGTLIVAKASALRPTMSRGSLRPLLP